MGYSQKAINEMYARALDCVDTVFPDLPADSDGKEGATGLRAQYEIIIGQSASQSGFEGTAEQGTAERSVARKRIRDFMSELARSAHSISRKKPGFERNFPAPSGKDDNELLTDARAVAAKAIEFKTDFTGRGFKVEFLESGADRVEAFETALGTTNTAQSSRGEAVGSKRTAYGLADEFFDTLDDFIRNCYRDQPQKLAAWKIATHIERSPKRKANEEPKP